jgi:hypothetical protein
LDIDLAKIDIPQLQQQYPHTTASGDPGSYCVLGAVCDFCVKNFDLASAKHYGFTPRTFPSFDNAKKVLLDLRPELNDLAGHFVSIITDLNDHNQFNLAWRWVDRALHSPLDQLRTRSQEYHDGQPDPGVL